MNERFDASAHLQVATRTDFKPDLLHSQAVHPLASAVDPAQAALTRATQALLGRQRLDGHWLFDLEADATIPSEYLMLHYYFGSVDAVQEKRIARYLRRRQHENGSWSLYEGGPGDISATVKAYFALKLAGDAPQEPHMQQARHWVRANGGAERVNVFTRIALAMFGQLPWATVPAMPVEMMFLPGWWFFNLSKVSYWSRCVIVPLLIIFAYKPVLRLRPEQGVEELFLAPPDTLRHLDQFKPGRLLANGFLLVDRALKALDPWMPRFLRQRALKKAEAWVRDHTQGVGGIGAIYPAMANAAVALKLRGADTRDPDLARTLQAIEDLVIEQDDETYCQPCVGPVWDTCLSLSALMEAGAQPGQAVVRQAVEWLFDQQVFVPGDWCDQARGLAPGGWAFQYENDKYPDVDDTAMVMMALVRAGAQDNPLKLKRLNQGLNWLLGLQNPDGSWGAFDIGNNYEYLNNIPFADHGALVDPGTSDLTARCVELLAMLGYDRSFPPVARALEFLAREQEECGAWYGRWGVNYLYGTWSVLASLGALGEDSAQPYVRKAVEWLCSVQNPDGGWGESCNSYDEPLLRGHGPSTASQTAWALLGLMAVGEADSASVTRGIEFLLRTQNTHGEWDEDIYTGTGFPRVFYLRYHGYSKYFPLWALGVHGRLRRGLPTRQQEILARGPIELGPLEVLRRAKRAG